MKQLNSLIICQPGGIFPDPHLWIEPRSQLSIRFAVFEGLVKYAADMSIMPSLAESWTVLNNAKEWIFTLREGVQYHDGSFLTAQDVAASIKNASREDVPGAYGTDALLYAYLGNAEIEVIDDLHLKIILPNSMADLPDLLAYIMIIPESFIGKDPVTIPGTGPFKTERVTERSYEFCRFGKYWGKVPPVDNLVFIDERDPQKRIQLFQEGKVDVITTLKKSEAELLANNSDAEFITHEMPLSIPAFLNCFDKPFSDKRVRQAVNYGTDVNEIIAKACEGNANRLNGPLSRFHFGVDPEYPPYPYDPEKAISLLKEAGYENGLAVTLFRPLVGPDESTVIADCLQRQWEKIGITLKEEIQPDRQQYALDVRGKNIHDLCIFDSSPISTYRVLLEKLNSVKAGPWWQGYTNPQFDELLEKAWETVDDKERADIYRQALQIVSDDAPWLFLFSPNEVFVVRKSVAAQFPNLCKRVDGIVALQ